MATPVPKGTGVAVFSIFGNDSTEYRWMILIGVSIKPLRAAKEFAIDLVYPKRCAGCDQRGAWLCDRCHSVMRYFKPPWCGRCGVPTGYQPCRCESTPDNLEQVRSVGPFDGWLRGAVTQFKYHGEWARAEHLAAPLASVVADLRPIDALVPVPLHPTRLRYRGFNQSLLMAQQTAALLGLEVLDVLIRPRRTDPQVTLGSEQRVTNVAGAFATREHVDLIGLSLVLVDDVITTGSTLSACAEMLYTAGATTVSAATITREM